MRRKASLGIVVLAVLLALSFVGCGGTATTTLASVQGYVTDDLGAAISGATITFFAPENTSASNATEVKKIMAVKTTAAGYYSIDGLTSGNYTLTVTPASTASGSTYTVANVVAKVPVTVAAPSALAGASSQYTSIEQNITLPRISTSSIKGKVVIKDAAGTNLTTLAAGKKLFVELGSGYYLPAVSTAGVVSVGTSYVTTTVAADGTFTFSAVPQIDFSGKTLTIEYNANDAAYSSGSTYVGYLTASLPANMSFKYDINSAIDISDCPIQVTTSTAPALALVSNSLQDVYGTNGTVAGVAIDLTTTGIVLTFNNTLIDNTAKDTIALYDSNGNVVASTVKVAGTTITVTPAAKLAYNSTYSLYYVARDGKTAAVSGTFTFKTVVDPTVVTKPTLVAGDSTKYDYWASSFYVAFDYNTNYSYKYFFKKATDANWTDMGTSYTVVDYNATTMYANFFASGMVYGDTAQFFVRATMKGGTAYVDSDVLSFKDTVAPSGFAGLTYNADSTYLGGTYTTAKTLVLDFTLPNTNEKMMLPTATISGTGATIGVITLYNGDKKARVEIEVAANTNLVGKTLRVTLKDAAGNQYVGSGTTATTFDYTF